MSAGFRWDAAAYDELANFQERLGRAVLARRSWNGDEVVMDAGCGSGRVTRHLANLVPQGRVYAVDRDPDMVRHARTVLAPFGDRVRVQAGDLLDARLPEPVDVVFSSATFHWVLDHDALFAHLLHLLRPGGHLLAQCGGEANIERALEITRRVMDEPKFREHLRGWTPPWRFEDEASTQERLLIAGFVRPEVSVEPTPETFPNREGFAGFVKAIPLRPHLSHLPNDVLREAFLARFLERCEDDLRPPWTLDYVRLNIQAWRDTA